MMEKNNFDGWSLLAVGEEAIIQPSKDGEDVNADDVENEINLVEVEEEQVHVECFPLLSIILMTDFSYS